MTNRKGPGARGRRAARVPVAGVVVALAVGGWAAADLGTPDAEDPTPSSVVRATAPATPAEATEVLPDDVAAHAPSGSGAGAVEVSASGRVVKDLGEPAGLVLAGARTASFTLTVDRVETRTSCPGRGTGTIRPERGVFLVVHVVATMAADVDGAGGGDVFMPLTAETFSVVGTDGVPHGGASIAGWSCFDDADLAAPFVGPGESTRGKVVLETDAATGWLVYSPSGEAGWQWALNG